MQRLQRFATLTLIGVFSSVIAGPGSAERPARQASETLATALKLRPVAAATTG